MKMLNHYLMKQDLKCQCIVLNGGEYRDEEGKIIRRRFILKKVRLVKL